MTRRVNVIKLYGDDWDGSIQETDEYSWSGQFQRDDFIRCFLCRRQVRCRDCPRSINLWNNPDAWHRWDKVGGGGFACDQCVTVPTSWTRSSASPPTSFSVGSAEKRTTSAVGGQKPDGRASGRATRMTSLSERSR